MSSIGIIDDRDVDRKLIVDGLSLSLGDDERGWNIIDSVPLTTLDEYPSWISQNKICVLVIDELLDEITNNGTAVNYRGHDLVDFIRGRFATLPIFVVTAHSNDLVLQERFKDVEGIIDRKDYGQSYRKFAPRIVRAAQQYLNVFQNELSELSELAKKTATGVKISDDERLRADAIRTKLDIAFSINSISGMNEWINEANNLVKQIEKLREEIERKVRGVK
jgi:hypothetical protein